MGVAWMQKMEDGKNKGGLLADEMGLGKTVQRCHSLRSDVDGSIALLVTRPSKEGVKTTLICTPVALLGQWFNEIRSRTDPPLSVYIHHSSTGKKAKRPADLLRYDVVLTTYTTIVPSRNVS
jgi:SNF2 family DNA or RNA helicase